MTDAKDAARYRWLRAQHWTDGWYVVARAEVLPLGVQTYSAENLDSVIDGALSGDQSQTMDGWRQTEVERLRTENERLRDIALRIGFARERDHWNDLDDAVDDLLSGAPSRPPTPPEQPPIDNAHVAEGCEQFAEVRNTVEIRTFTNHPPTACAVQTPVCPKCGQIDVRIPRMGIYHVCPTPESAKRSADQP